MGCEKDTNASTFDPVIDPLQEMRRDNGRQHPRDTALQFDVPARLSQLTRLWG